MAGPGGGLLGRTRRVFALLTNPRTPKLPRLAVAMAIGYLLWPPDLIPDFVIPLVGWLDDLGLLWLSTRWLLRRDPALAKSREGHRETGG